jgi:DNA-binding transcriptional ArsR family regulator
MTNKYATEPQPQVAVHLVERAANLFGLLSTPLRLRIILALCSGEKSVAELLSGVQMGGRPNMSQHLNLLYRAGVLSKRREGARVYYRVHVASQDLVHKALRALLGVEVGAVYQ